MQLIKEYQTWNVVLNRWSFGLESLMILSVFEQQVSIALPTHHHKPKPHQFQRAHRQRLLTWSSLTSSTLGGTTTLIYWRSFIRLAGDIFHTVRQCKCGCQGLDSMREEVFRHFWSSRGIIIWWWPWAEFTASETKKFLTTWGVRQKISSAYHHQSNGRAEVAVNSIKRLLTPS